MKKLLLISLLLITSTITFGQIAYIEVKGEPDLSVYLNGKYKGKTTAEFNGLIIENVSAGSNLIKIEKEGYTPFEETITVKAGEVLAYKVKPFTKHKVYISEEGNTEETSKKATLKTGKLIIQSVPIEIKITIPDIDGINNFTKTKDKWQADEIPAGNYKITFTYNQKVITKTIEVMGSETISLFVNMLSGDFKTSNSLDEKKAKEREDYLKFYKVNKFIDSLCTKYKFKEGLTKSQFRNYNPEAAEFMSSCSQSGETMQGSGEYIYTNDYDYGYKKASTTDVLFYNGIIERYSYNIIIGKDKANEVTDSYAKMVNLIESSSIPKEYITKSDSSLSINLKSGLLVRISAAIYSKKGYAVEGKNTDGFLSICFDNSRNTRKK
jgi:hypothetical protein